mmetsp:Transcript_1436/g.5021  ORF Transcript_1436/g.5021 Transcript_1436/m.5021 type:complete len:213 (+) Transcript_1436:2047-2685(+)
MSWVWPQWSTPSRCATITSQSWPDSTKGPRRASTPSSTVLRSFTSREGNGKLCEKSSGKRSRHVSSPMCTTRLPWSFSWRTRLSSSNARAERLEPMSTKVGRDPVVSPFRRCMVVVGASATNSRSLHPDPPPPPPSQSSLKTGSAFLCLRVPLASSAPSSSAMHTKSLRRASTTIATTLSYRGRAPSTVGLTSATWPRLRRKPDAKEVTART